MRYFTPSPPLLLRLRSLWFEFGERAAVRVVLPASSSLIALHVHTSLSCLLSHSTARSYVVVNTDEMEGGEEKGYWLLRALDGATSGLVPRNHLEEIAAGGDSGAKVEGERALSAPADVPSAASPVTVSERTETTTTTAATSDRFGGVSSVGPAPVAKRRLTTVALAPTHPRRQWVFVVMPNRDEHAKWVGELRLCAESKEEMAEWLNAMHSVAAVLSKKRENLRSRTVTSP